LVYFLLCLYQLWRMRKVLIPGRIKADKIDPGNYYGITVANGMIGIVSAPEPFKVKNVVLAGAYDLVWQGQGKQLS
jgi:hypothetical protein